MREDGGGDERQSVSKVGAGILGGFTINNHLSSIIADLASTTRFCGAVTWPFMGSKAAPAQALQPIAVAHNYATIHNTIHNHTMADSSRLKATVFVGGLDHAVTQQTLYHAFLPFGDIVEVNLPKPEAPGASDSHRGFGYVEFETAGDAADAIDNMDRSELYGQVIKVAAAKPQKDANEGLGSKTAIWEQVRYFVAG